jgi:hypothetical protein
MTPTPPPPTLNKVQQILAALENKTDRAKLALDLGYTNPKSLDIYMRRKGFLYDSQNATYIPIKPSGLKNSKTFTTDKRIGTILTLFTEEDADPKKIAEITGFESHIELAEFMKSNNFTWNNNVGNYTRPHNLDEPAIDDTTDISVDASEFYIYLPLLRKLQENKDRLYKLISPHSNLHEENSIINGGFADMLFSLINKDLHPLIENHLSQTHQTLPQFLEQAITQYLKSNNATQGPNNYLT